MFFDELKLERCLVGYCRFSLRGGGAVTRGGGEEAQGVEFHTQLLHLE